MGGRKLSGKLDKKRFAITRNRPVSQPLKSSDTSVAAVGGGGGWLSSCAVFSYGINYFMNWTSVKRRVLSLF